MDNPWAAQRSTWALRLGGFMVSLTQSSSLGEAWILPSVEAAQSSTSHRTDKTILSTTAWSKIILEPILCLGIFRSIPVANRNLFVQSCCSSAFLVQYVKSQSLPQWSLKVLVLHYGPQAIKMLARFWYLQRFLNVKYGLSNVRPQIASQWVQIGCWTSRLISVLVLDNRAAAILTWDPKLLPEDDVQSPLFVKSAAPQPALRIIGAKHLK